MPKQRKGVKVAVENHLPDSEFGDFVAPQSVAGLFDRFVLDGSVFGLTRKDLGTTFRMLDNARRAGQDNGVLAPKGAGEKLTCRISCIESPEGVELEIHRESSGAAPKLRMFESASERSWRELGLTAGVEKSGVKKITIKKP